MKISIIKPKEYLYKSLSIINKECQICKSKNVNDNICFDCKNTKKEIYYIERTIIKKEHNIKLDFRLSKEQIKASNFFLNHLIERKNAFLYSVCGSGKTEIMYESILYALNHNMKVLIAIPRKEIVKELYDRLKNVFINTKISFLDYLHHDDSGELIISTVNQMLYYEKEFDLIILDEADAYPYVLNSFLKRLLYKSLKSDGVLFLMSATIKERTNFDRYIIKRRYHNYDLAKPIFIKHDYKNMPSFSFFQRFLINGRKLIIYVSSIKLGKDLSAELNTDLLSSKNKKTRDIIENFKTNDKEILVSTTILERGVTIPNLDVLIYDGDNQVFTYQTIIQICGRVGRSYKDPSGNVYILYNKNHLKFKRVIKYIKEMNK